MLSENIKKLRKSKGMSSPGFVDWIPVKKSYGNEWLLLDIHEKLFVK